MMWDQLINSWKEKLCLLNQQILEKYQDTNNFDFIQLRNILKEKISGKFFFFERLSQQTIEKKLLGKSLVGVDGSVNRVGSTFPHYLTLFQALAKSTNKKEQPMVEQDFHTPLLREERQKMVAQAAEEEVPLGLIQDRIESMRLAELELRSAYRALEEYNCWLIIFDGPLWRYEKRAPDLWPKFKELVQKKEVWIVGVVEEVSSAFLAPLLEESLPDKMRDYYDRDLLFGLLAPGEGLYIPQELKEGYLTYYLRPSSEPQAIAFDFLKEQRAGMKLVADLLFTLTPQKGRGVPLWLDIVDKEVRITKQLMDGLLNTTLSPEIINKLLLAQRMKRIY